MIALLLGWCLLCCAYALWSHRRQRMLRLTRNVPNLSGELPFIGHALGALGDNEHLWKFVKNLNTETIKAGGVTKGWIGPAFYMSVTDPEMALALSNTCLAKNYMYKFAASWLGEGLITASVPTWKKHRRMLCSAFNPAVLDGFLDIFNRQSARLTEGLMKEVGKGQFDHWPYFSENALETICQTAFGIPANEESVADKEYATAVGEMLNAVIVRSSRLWMHFDRLYRLTSTKRQEDRAVTVLKRMSWNVIQKRKETINVDLKNGNGLDSAANKGRFKPFLDLLLELNEEGQLNDTEIREEVDTLIVAGHDTTSHTMLFLFILLGAYPEVQEKVYRELREVFGTSDRDVTKDDLSQLVYTEAVVKESCRLYPVIPVLARYAERDVKFDKFTIPAGTGILLCLWGIQRSQCWGADVNEFNPERWLNPATLPSSAASFAAFSLGRRGCMGKPHAMMSMKTTIAHLIRRYRVTGDDKSLRLKFDFMIKPVSGHHITVQLRKES